MNDLAELYLSDGTSTGMINLLSRRNGFAVQNWQPVVADVKGGGIFQNSPLAENRRLVARFYDNAVETFTLAGRGGTANRLIEESQRIRRLLEKAVSYWTSDWQNTPVFLIARGVGETNVRYALLYDYRAPGDGNPFASPFTGPDAAIFGGWELILERGHWTETPPGTGTAIEVSGLGTFNSVTYGRAATTTNEVYIANKQNIANISHIFYLDASTATFSGNLFGAALPYKLLPEPVAVGDIIYVICDTTITDSGPFCSVVWDIGVAIGDITIVYEYWNGAWVTLTSIIDNTNGFENTGVNSQHWTQISDWATTTINAITGYMIRFRVTTVGASALAPTQQNRQPYSITWANALIDDAQIGGDIPALLLSKITNQGDTPAAVDRVLMGLRSTARGSLFNAYLLCSDEQNQSGVTVAVGTDSSFAAYVPQATGRVARYVPSGGGADTLLPRVTISLDDTLTSSYKGRFRVLMRAVQVGGTAGDMFTRLRAALFSSTSTAFFTSPTIYTAIIGEVQLFDFGQFVFPPTSHQENTDYYNLVFIIDAGSDSTTPDLYFYDLILLPIDEWAGDFLNPSSDASTVLGTFTVNRRLEVDAISYPRVPYSAVLKQVTDEAVVTNWQPVTSAPAILQANADQRLWFLMADFSGGTWQSHIENAYSLQVQRQQRYLSMRGSR